MVTFVLLCVCFLDKKLCVHGIMCAVITTSHYLGHVMVKSDNHDHPDQIRDVLLPDPALCGPELAPREEQDVQEGVHQEHQGRCRRRR